MKTLKLNQMENYQGGGDCDVANAAFGTSMVSSFWAVLVAGPIGIGFALTSFAIATYGLLECTSN